jgi:hypothetical protein
MYRWGDAFGGRDGMLILQAGILDDIEVINSMRIDNELFVPKRVRFVRELQGVHQNEGMPSA